MTVVTRFAPSPTGFLHIGGARTALFNWLFARHHGGNYLLRIEDTDRARSTQSAIDAILDGLSWLGLNWDGEVTYQFARAARHAEVARQMLAEGKAYHCYASPQELDEMRAAQRKAGVPMRYDGRWRDRDPSDAPPGVAPVIRLKAPQSGKTVIQDAVQGEVAVENAQLDDMILLRADGTPTYMLAVVVDDQDMGVTHVIRGDDHLNNAFRQLQIIRAMGWPEPVYAHIPLIHGADGAKLSKRHGALGVDAYRDMGFLPAALRNYLLRLGWGHGDDEIISTEQAIEWFDLAGVGRSPSRFDTVKLTNLNAHYLRAAPDPELLPLVLPRIEAKVGAIDAAGRQRIERGLDGVKQRSRTLVELADNLVFYARGGAPTIADDKARSLLTADAKALLGKLAGALEAEKDWRERPMEEAVRRFADSQGVKLGQVAQPLRVALTGSTVSPGIFEVLSVLGPDETGLRLRAASG
ncbi:glutamate--tRNA ligase [Enhydrobacter sp.]|jgi:glutamyl-tRNA synthetase|uniref:glutamate--tRNA ligase n=1 Tax=Enhydrobacter sp. TaxID=1894999 RepID=UPI00260C3507|nr:glutamate--tRNA ligase [Enhydrobacter sp.]WIM13973.1 MAG: Glutamyl-tRNA synthetase [Enhydrobacter sp.]